MPIRVIDFFIVFNIKINFLDITRNVIILVDISYNLIIIGLG
jgi:hypothetical protein